MFVVFLKFAKNRDKAKELMGGHNDWIRQGFDDGVFMVVGSLKPALGGAILAHNVTLEALERRVGEDPFVEEGVVTPEIYEISPAKAASQFQFLLGETERAS